MLAMWLGLLAHAAIDTAGRSPHTRLAPAAVNMSEQTVPALKVKKDDPSVIAQDTVTDSPVERVTDDVLDVKDVLEDDYELADLQLRPKSKVMINATIVITDIPAIDADLERAEFQGQLVLMWRDPRLKLPPGQNRIQLNLNDVWTPQIDFYNVIGAVKVPAEKLALLQVQGRSFLVKTQRFFGQFACRTDGTYFPFDKQLLPVVVEMFGNPSDAVAFDPDLYAGVLSHVPSAKDDFDVDGVRTRLSEVQKVTGRSYSRLSVSVLVKRKWINKFFPCYAPVTILLALVCMSAYVDPASVPARTTLTIVCLLSSIVIYQNLEKGAPGFSYSDALGVWTIMCAATAVSIFLRVHWLRQTEDVAWKAKMEKLAEEPEPEDNAKDNSTKKMLRNLGMLGRESSPPSKRVDEVARKYLPLIFVMEFLLTIIPALGSLTHDYGGNVEHIH
jgi:hypothetical protein